jgi:hypothetical protein
VAEIGSVEWLMSVLQTEDTAAMEEASKGLKVFADSTKALIPVLEEAAQEAGGSSLKNKALGAFGVGPWQRMRRSLKGSLERGAEARDRQSLVDGRTPRRE